VPTIGEWLIGMAEYSQRFADNDIETSVLRDLTDQDLKDLGVSLGHRRKMLRARSLQGHWINRARRRTRRDGAV
jgi:hypothetical protein